MPGQRRFSSKADARNAIWDRLRDEKLARFPFPPHGRIPNFKGAKEAALRLLDTPPWRDARAIKVNPDAPQRYLREEALRRGIIVYVPTPRLRGGFRKFDPANIPPDKIAEAAGLSRGAKWGEAVALEDMPQLDAIVTGSVAVAAGGRRCGKGEGYSDIEYAILRELGHKPVPVATTVHDVQVVAGFPAEANDLPLSVIATPTRTIVVKNPPPPPSGINWDLLDDDALEVMPVLGDLRALQGVRRGK